MDLGWTARRGLLVGLSTLAVGLAFLAVATAQPPAEGATEDNAAVKPPWEWTLEERLNARFDPQKIRERMRNRGHNHRLTVKGQPDGFEVLSGQEHPELFLPTRLFDHLLGLTFFSTEGGFQGAREACAELYNGTLEIDSSFWRDLSIITATYRAEKSRYKALEEELRSVKAQGGSKAEIEDLRRLVKVGNQARCQLRFEALKAAREHFGRSEFDRFLYETQAAYVMDAGVLTRSLRSARAHQEQGCPNVR